MLDNREAVEGAKRLARLLSRFFNSATLTLRIAFTRHGYYSHERFLNRIRKEFFRIVLIRGQKERIWQMVKNMSARRRSVIQEQHVKLFRSGRNQAVRISREFELPGHDAIMRKEGE